MVTMAEAMGNNVPVSYWATSGGDPLSAHESRSEKKHFKGMDNMRWFQELSPEIQHE